MKLDTWEIFKAFFNPTFVKILLFAIVVAIIFRIIRILIDRKLKSMESVSLKSSTFVIIALGLAVAMFLLLR